MSLAREVLVPCLVLLLLSFAACGQSGHTPITLSERDGGKTVELNKGDTLVITLEGNITTGYNWEMLPQAPAVLRQVAEPQVTPDSKALGAPGKIALRFEAVKTGRASLELVYHRPWEKAVPPLKTFEVTIVVK